MLLLLLSRGFDNLLELDDKGDVSARDNGSGLGRFSWLIQISAERLVDFQAYALFPTMQITSLVEARRQEDQGLNHLFKYWYSGTSIGTPLEISLVSIHGKEYRYPSSLMELEYGYWLLSTGTGCLRTVVFGVP
ncbi:hypothetical protein GQ457_11G031970 [Hibiscus cannabinus]